jgi:hypothetical protein
MKKNKTIYLIIAGVAAYFIYNEYKKRAAVRAADVAIKALQNIKLPKK